MSAERYATTSRTAARISSGEALSPASADMCDQGTAAVGPDHERAAELGRISDGPGLDTAAARAREESLRDAPGAEQLGHVRDLRACGPVADSVLVGEHRQLDPLAPAELGGVARSRLSDQHETDAGRLELTPGAIQLDRVILAENSPVVPQPDERGRRARSTGRRDGRRGARDRAGRSRRARRRVTAGSVCGRRACGGKATTGYSRGGGSRAQAPVDAVARADRARDADALPGVARGEARPVVRRLPRPLALVGVRPRGVLELARRVRRCSVLREAPSAVLGNDAMPGAKWFPGARLSYAEHMFAGKDPDVARDPARVRVCASWLDDVGRAARADGGDRRGIARARASARATASPPTCRTSPRRSRRCSRARRSARCGHRPRPSSACGAWSTASRRSSRRCCSRSTATATAARTSTARDEVDADRGEIPSLARVVRLGYLDGSGWEDGFLGSERVARVRAASVRPPAVGAVQLRARPGCRSRSSTGRAGSCSST